MTGAFDAPHRTVHSGIVDPLLLDRSHPVRTPALDSVWVMLVVAILQGP